MSAVEQAMAGLQEALADEGVGQYPLECVQGSWVWMWRRGARSG